MRGNCLTEKETWRKQAGNNCNKGGNLAATKDNNVDSGRKQCKKLLGRSSIEIPVTATSVLFVFIEIPLVFATLMKGPRFVQAMFPS